MRIEAVNQWQHKHEFTFQAQANEQKTLRVVVLTAVMMMVEIITGALFGSMALQADGWHMGTHAAALGITLFAYRYARRHASDPRYSFGTGKISVLGGFTSAIVLMVVAILMAVEAGKRLIDPQPIQYTEAIIVAIIGLAVNLISVRLLGEDHHSHGSDALDHDHEHHHTDHNLKAAYLHVLADALTSVLAISALLVGRVFGWVWMDAVMGIVGGLVISRWAIGLLRETRYILLDGRCEDKVIDRVREVVEQTEDTRVCDLHVWKISDRASAAILSLVTHDPQPVEYYHRLISQISEIRHAMIEIYKCSDKLDNPCDPRAPIQPVGERPPLCQ